MEKKVKVFNLIIVDESGSMNSIREATISSFNELIQDYKQQNKEYPEQEHYVTFLSFNSSGIKEYHIKDVIEKVAALNLNVYRPSGLTPLYDAMGHGISLQEKMLVEGDLNRVEVTILTDGLENASKEYTHSMIKALIESKKQAEWSFTYMGTDHDVETVARELNFDESIHFDKSAAGINEMRYKKSQSRYNKLEHYKEYYDKNNKDQQ